ncbi:hypothetical protein ASG87_11160 [Frateuria sp. Soil773]|uniref:hypothetical protein n=1 Tax=Frateuria sp. Soil773 TaxID=1736407 RepID=UPI0006FC49F9|nr:hypothetical protein [Frateuria sp. Soil773]KRF02038.1 hypothetical protein ASG87_11160 [Frateuria sp. Soil773]
MAEPTSTGAWPRPYWQPGDEEAVLQFFVFGQFAPDLAIPAARHGSNGLPEGVELQRFQNAVLRHWDGYPLAGALGALLKEDAPETYEQARIEPDVLVVRGTLKDRDSLDYLRDTMGVLAALLDIGGKSVLDPQILTLFDAAAWRRHYLVPGGAPPRNHVLILRSADEGADRSRVHTRGMRKFGRPDLELRNIPDAEIDRAGLLCERLVELQALGAQFAQGQPLDVDGVPGGLVAQPGGSMDDPRFSNTHVAFRWPV